MVGHGPLKAVILVRIQVPEPSKNPAKAGFFVMSHLKTKSHEPRTNCCSLGSCGWLFLAKADAFFHAGLWGSSRGFSLGIVSFVIFGLRANAKRVFEDVVHIRWRDEPEIVAVAEAVAVAKNDRGVRFGVPRNDGEVVADPFVLWRASDAHRAKSQHVLARLVELVQRTHDDWVPSRFSENKLGLEIQHVREKLCVTLDFRRLNASIVPLWPIERLGYRHRSGRIRLGVANIPPRDFDHRSVLHEHRLKICRHRAQRMSCNADKFRITRDSRNPTRCGDEISHKFKCHETSMSRDCVLGVDRHLIHKF